MKPSMTRVWMPGPRWLRRHRLGRSPCRRCHPAGRGIRRRCRSPAGVARGLRDDLLALAADAAARAWELAVGLDPDAGLHLDADADLARRADRALGTPPCHARRPLRHQRTRVARRALAWRHGGAGGLELLHADWNPATEATGTAELLTAARAALRDVTPATASVTRNRVTAGRVELRLGRDFLWYPYAQSDGEWEPAARPGPTPHGRRRRCDPARVTASLRCAGECSERLRVGARVVRSRHPARRCVPFR